MIRPFALAASLAASATAASAELITASDVEAVAAAMARGGFTVAAAQSNSGDPALLAQHPDVNFRVFFMGCEDGANCQHLLFSAQYTIEGDFDPEVLSAYMAANAMGGAHVSLDDSETTTLRYFVTTVGGVSKEQFSEILFLWRTANLSYRRAIAPPEAQDGDGQ